MPTMWIKEGLIGGGGAVPPAGGKTLQINENGNLDVTIPAMTTTYTRDEIEIALVLETSSRDAYQAQLDAAQARVDALQAQLDLFGS